MLSVSSRTSSPRVTPNWLVRSDAVQDCHSTVTSRPYRINIITAKKVNDVLDRFLAASLIYHSTSPYSRPTELIPNKCGGARITINYTQVNAIGSFGRLPTPSVDGVGDSLGKRRTFSLLFDIVSSFHQITADKHKNSGITFNTPDQPFQWLDMPPGCSAAPVWFA